MSKITKIATCITTALTILLSLIFIKPVMAAETVTIQPGNVINIEVTETEKTSNSEMQLKDAGGNVIASWKNESDVTYTNANNKPDSSGFKYNLRSLTKWADLTVWSVSHSENGKNAIRTAEGNIDVKYNSAYDITALGYDSSLDTYVVPASTIMINIDEKWAEKALSAWMRENGNVYYFDEYAGKKLEFTYDEASHSSYVYVKAEGTGMYYYGGRRNTLSTQPVLYVKKKIKLSEYYPEYFNDDGTFVVAENYYKGEIDENSVFDVRNDDIEGRKCSMLFILSGTVLNMAIPDENGCVDVYLEAKGGSMSVELRFGYKSQMTSDVLDWVDTKVKVTKEIEATAINLPKRGVNVINLDAGTYYLLEVSSSGQVVGKEKITVADKKGIQSFSYSGTDKEQASDEKKETQTSEETTKKEIIKTDTQETTGTIKENVIKTETSATTVGEGEQSEEESVTKQESIMGEEELPASADKEKTTTEESTTETNNKNSNDEEEKNVTKAETKKDASQEEERGTNIWIYIMLIIIILIFIISGIYCYFRQRGTNNFQSKEEMMTDADNRQ